MSRLRVMLLIVMALMLLGVRAELVPGEVAEATDTQDSLLRHERGSVRRGMDDTARRRFLL